MFRVRCLDVDIVRSVGKPPAEFKRVLWTPCPAKTTDRLPSKRARGPGPQLDRELFRDIDYWLPSENHIHSPAMRTLIALFLAALSSVTASSAEPGKTTVIIKGIPRFEQRGSFAYVLVRESSRNERFGWRGDPSTVLSPGLLNTNQVYTFTLDQEPPHGPPPHYVGFNWVKLPSTTSMRHSR